ncbi:putative membrane protein [Sphingomonas zeicaulis]|uniref:hypothetical protein n=1 Tax=Sphingomonas zeicaulis TaxID=1632740 RepID=UPI003D218E23
MAKLFPEIIDIDDAMRCSRFGRLAALAFAGLAVLGGVLGLIIKDGRTGISTDEDKILLLVIVGVEILVALIAAWRFHHNRGLIAGSVLMLVFLVEFIGKFFIGFPGVLGIILHLFIAAGIVNGIRGAIAMRNTDTLDTEALAREFE